MLPPLVSDLANSETGKGWRVREKVAPETL
jgi:hypothetical protein